MEFLNLFSYAVVLRLRNFNVDLVVNLGLRDAQGAIVSLTLRSLTYSYTDTTTHVFTQ